MEPKQIKRLDEKSAVPVVPDHVDGLSGASGDAMHRFVEALARYCARRAFEDPQLNSGIRIDPEDSDA